jgi:hypothetical protein
MRMRTGGIAMGLAALCAAGLASAAPCYLVYDQNDAVIYRDLAPPFDLSTTGAGASERDALRKRGHHLLVAEFDHCDAVGYISPETGGTTATVDDIVMQLRPAAATSVGTLAGNKSAATSAGARASAAGSGARAGTTAARPAAAAARAPAKY